MLAAKKQFPSKSIEARLHQKIHDRNFIIDKKEVWSIGTSYKEKVGNKPTTIVQIKDDTALKIIAHYSTLWSESEELR